MVARITDEREASPAQPLSPPQLSELTSVSQSVPPPPPDETAVLRAPAVEKTKSVGAPGTLRFITAGSVDDGKSTLIGRLLYDSKNLLKDQVRALSAAGTGELDFASLTDGLRAEREQGITIDVAYRYFSTPRRRFIVGDTPGHVQYARNMVTAASTAPLALILVDATLGVTEQTIRHAYLSYLLGIKHVVVCVNKMDLVNYSQSTFRSVQDKFSEFKGVLSFKTLDFIPVSALLGENLVEPSTNLDWYQGPALLQFLEEIEIEDDSDLAARFPVQWIIKDNRATARAGSAGSSDTASGTSGTGAVRHNFRGYAGQIVSGTISVGDEIVALPSGLKTRVKSVQTFDSELESASAPVSVTLVLEDDIDVGRGDILAHPESLPRVESRFSAQVCWMSEQPLVAGKFYEIKHASKISRVKIVSIQTILDLDLLEERENDEQELRLNDIGRVSFIATEPIVYDYYEENRLTGSFILIDEHTKATAGAGLLAG